MATLYFNNATLDNDWNTLGNWWSDSALTTPALALPTSSDDVVVLPPSEYFYSLINSGSTPTIKSLTIYSGSN
ncbi:MAG: hypothetical protein ACKO7N_09285, partial [Candidatus Nitrosotenuis sp.]